MGSLSDQGILCWAWATKYLHFWSLTCIVLSLHRQHLAFRDSMAWHRDSETGWTGWISADQQGAKGILQERDDCAIVYIKGTRICKAERRREV